MIWRTHLAGPLSTPTQSPALPAYLFIGDGTTLRSLTACGGEVAQSFPLDGSLAQAPVVVQLESLAFAVFATTSSGSLYRININTSTGELTLGWRRDLRRPSCAADTELASPVVFRRAVGNTAFRTTFAADVVYAAPVDRCGDDHGNRVIALNAVDGATLWIFNNNGTYRVGAVSRAPALDLLNNQLYVGATSPSGGGNTLFAIDVLHGTPVWVDNAGSITASPVLVGDHVYVASRAGSVRAYLAGGDDYGGASLDWVTATPGPIASDLTVSDHLIAFALAAGSIGVLNDTGTWAASLLPVGVGTAANTAPVLHPSDRRIYAGANDGAAWQFDLTGVSAHQSISSARTTACCDPVLVVDSNADATTSVNLVIGTSLGDLAKLAIPWPAEPGHA